MFFVYMIGYFTALILILPMLLIKRFGVATAVYVPFVVLGFPVNYYFEWIVEHTWKSPWSGLGWSVAFLAIGFSADLAYRFLPAHVSERLRAILVGIVIACVSFFGDASGSNFCLHHPTRLLSGRLRIFSGPSLFWLALAYRK